MPSILQMQQIRAVIGVRRNSCPAKYGRSVRRAVFGELRSKLRHNIISRDWPIRLVGVVANLEPKQLMADY